MEKITAERKITLKIMLQHATHKQQHRVMVFERNVSIDGGYAVVREYASRNNEIVSRSHMIERAVTNFARQFAAANHAAYENDEIDYEKGWK